MIRSTINIITAFFVLLILSCQKESSVNAKKAILKYSLKNSYDNIYSNDSTLLFNLYENLKTNHFLYVVQNKNRDTVFKFFDSTKFELRVKNFFKYKSNYFTALWKPSPKNYIGTHSIPNSKNNLFENLYRYDSLNIYKVDTLSYQLTTIKKPTLDSIKKTAIDDLNLQGIFYALKSNSKLRLVKDTLFNHKVLYEYDVGLEIKKSSQYYNLKPYFFNKRKVELDENNLSSFRDKFLTDRDFKGTAKYYYRYDDKYNNIGFSRIDFIFNQSNKEHIIPAYLDSLFILDDNYRKKNIDTLSSLQIELFKYKNGNYFFSLSQQGLEYRNGTFPSIYHLDTLNWDIEHVLPFNTNDDKYKKLNKIQETINLSTIYKSNLPNLLDVFEIVKVKNKYKLIKTK